MLLHANINKHDLVSLFQDGRYVVASKLFHDIDFVHHYLTIVDICCCILHTPPVEVANIPEWD